MKNKVHFCALILWKNICRPRPTNGARYFSLNPSKFETVEEILDSKVLRDVNSTLQKGSILKLQTIGSGAPGAPNSLYVATINDGFLFNCGEGTTRSTCEVPGVISSLSGIFVTSCSWENVSGISCVKEFCFSRTVNQKTISAYGPANLAHVINKFNIDKDERSSRFMKFFEIENDEFEFEGGFKVKGVPIFPTCHNGEETAEVEKEKYPSKNNYVLSYICTSSSYTGIPRRILTRAGVPPGGPSRRLRRGESVVLDDGRVVSPEDVPTELYNGGSFIVIDVPTTDYLDSLVSCSDFDFLQMGAEPSNALEVIVHFSPSEVMKDPRYLEWVNSFSPSVSHLVINDKSTCLGLQQSLKLQVMLNNFLPRVFPMFQDPNSRSQMSQDPNSRSQMLQDPSNRSPMLQDLGTRPYTPSNIRNNKNNSKLSAPLTMTGEYGFGGPTVQAVSNLQYFIRPAYDFDSSMCPNFVPADLINACMKRESVVASYKEMNAVFRSLRRSHPGQDTFPNFVFLGTGSTYPSPKRNVSSILVNLSPKQTILLDCGQGTYNQLVRFFGMEKCLETLRKLEMVYCSHHHYDHITGLPSLLMARDRAFKEVGKKPNDLYLLASSYALNYLRDIDECFPILRSHIRLVKNSHLDKKRRFLSHIHDRILHSLSLEELSIITVPHCKDSFGISLTGAEGVKFTYSGDTMPSEELVQIGMGSDLLIHEATLEDGLEDEAKLKRHCTVSQAMQVAKDMQTKFTILTHFSQRYQLLPLLEGRFPPNVGIAFDNMKVSIEDLPYLPHLIPTFERLFSRQLQTLKLRKIRREM